MTSLIDPNIFPDYRAVRKRDLRQQFSITKRELEALQLSSIYRVALRSEVIDLDLDGVDSITIERFSATSVYDPATYKRVLVEPTHEGKVQDKNGAWFEVQLNSGYVHVAWFGDTIEGVRDAATVSKRIYFTPGVNYTMVAGTGAVITAIDEDYDIEASQSDFTIVQSAESLINVAGTLADVQTVSSYNGAVWTVPDAAKFGKGNIIKIGDAITPHWWQQRDTTVGNYGVYRAGEFCAVDSGVGATLTLADTPEWATDRIATNLTDIMNISISGVADNGSGLCRVATTKPHFYTTGLNILVAAVTGAVEANGTWQITVIDSTHFDLIGSTSPTAYINGGTSRKTLTYSTHAAANLQVGRIQDGLSRIRIGRIFCAASVTAMQRFIRCSARKNIDWDITYIQRSAGIIMSPISCFGGRISFYADSTGANNVGYITVFGGGHGIHVDARGSGTVRHHVDGGAATTGDGVIGLIACGASAYIDVTATGPNIGSTQVANATHGGTFRWTWNLAKAVQGPSTIAVRGVGHTVIGARSSRAGGFGTFSQFFIGVASAADNGAGLIRLTISGSDGRGPDLVTDARVRVMGATGASAVSTNGFFHITKISDTVIDLQGSTFSSSVGATTAVVDSAFDAADGFRVIDCTGEDITTAMIDGGNNGGSVFTKGCHFTTRMTSSTAFVAGRTLDAQDFSLKFNATTAIRVIGTSVNTERVDIDGGIIRCDGNLGHIFDSNSVVQPIIFNMHNVTIEAGGTVASLFRSLANGVSNVPSAGSKIGNIRVKCTSLTSFISGKTLLDLAPFCDGPIWVNDQLVLGPYGGTDVNVTQSTDKSTTVVADGRQGLITLNAAALAASTPVTFAFTNGFITAKDILQLQHQSGGTAGAYIATAQCGAGTANVTLTNISLVLKSEAVVLRYQISKGGP